MLDDKMRKQEERELRNFYNKVSENQKPIVHSYIFKMCFPYERFRIKIDKITKLCAKYGKIFGFAPRFHVIRFDFEIVVKFRILAIDSNKLLNYQPEFAKDLYKIILSDTII